jgi:hypothetical protein
MLYLELLNLINNGNQITIVSKNKNTNSEVARLYFTLYHNPLYFNKISVSKTIIINHKIRASVHGRVIKKEEMKQIHFVHIDKLEKWMLETNERLSSKLKMNEINQNIQPSLNQDIQPSLNQDININQDNTNITNIVLKKYKLHTKIMYKQRIIILLDDVVIPDKLNPSKSITGNEIDSLEHHEWKLYLTNLIKKYNELKSKYFIVSIKQRGRRTKKDKFNSKLDELGFKPLSDEEKQIIHETDIQEFTNTNKIENSEIKLTEEQINAQIRLQSKISNYNVNRLKFNQNDVSVINPLDQNYKSDLEILQEQIINISNLEPDPQHPSYITKFDILNDIFNLKIPTFNEIMISMDETCLLNQNLNINLLKNQNSLIFHIAVNGLPQLINYKSPNYLNINAWKDINMLRIDYMIISDKFEILKQMSHYIANPNVHNTVKFEVNNKINDDYRNEHGISFTEIAEFIKNDILVFNIKCIISHGTDVNYNLLLLEYERNILNLDIFKNMIIINTKQYLWKQDVKERMEDFEECRTCNTKLEMIYNLLKHRLRINK